LWEIAKVVDVALAELAARGGLNLISCCLQ
jgi:hypothetical protein